ncbi:MAG: hypothetical protein QNJ46_25585 [Leptolyngbyaceae cyanobacterium MO_188.B28]|nr:hypothetical protein [Leptolyngbyaceae cyanobacterium MO_188.B28]
MSGPLKRQSNSKAQSSSPVIFPSPLLHVLDSHQSPDDDFLKPLKIALRGETDVSISRAEIDLRKAMQSMAFMAKSNIDSFPTLTALSLPPLATALFWAIYALLHQQYQNPNLDNLIRHRNHDARLLFQQLAQLDLSSWYAQSVDKVNHAALPTEIQFPSGHPIPGRMYRRHPLKTKCDCYYPVTNYFYMLAEEREQALINLLRDLGATKIVVEAIGSDSLSPTTADNQQKVIEYADQPQKVPGSIDTQQYPWLPYEPAWQSVVNERINKSIPSAHFNFDIDVMEMLRTQNHTVADSVPELESMVFPASDEVRLAKVIQRRKVQVEFGGMQAS